MKAVTTAENSPALKYSGVSSATQYWDEAHKNQEVLDLILPLLLSVLARFLLNHPIVVFAALVTLRSESRQSLWMLVRWQQRMSHGNRIISCGAVE